MKGNYVMGNNFQTGSDENVVDELHESEEFDIKRAQIMLIEATPSVGEMIYEVLTQETDYDVQWVQDGKGFLQAIEEGAWPPDLLILDVSSLIKDYKYLVQNAVTNSIGLPPVIIMSGWSPAYAKQVLGQDRASNVLVKPFDIDTLLDRVHKVLGKRTDSTRTRISESISSVVGLPQRNSPTIH